MISMILRKWKGQYPSISVTNVKANMFNHGRARPNDGGLPCAKEESPICARLTVLSVNEDQRILRYVTTNYFEQDTSLSSSGLWGFYTEKVGGDRSQHSWRLG